MSTPEGTKDEAQNNATNKLLTKAGLANTELVVREYQFTEDNELDALNDYACGATGTKTITPLPDNTIAMKIFIQVDRTYRAAPSISFKRTSGGTAVFLFTFGTRADTSDIGWLDGIFEIPTNGNQFYINSVTDSVATFKILGYKVKGDNLP